MVMKTALLFHRTQKEETDRHKSVYLSRFAEDKFRFPEPPDESRHD
jgi:hypothetical protein